MVNLPDIPLGLGPLRRGIIDRTDFLLKEIEAAQERISREIIEGSTIGEVEDARDGEERLDDRLRKIETRKADRTALSRNIKVALEKICV